MFVALICDTFKSEQGFAITNEMSCIITDILGWNQMKPLWSEAEKSGAMSCVKPLSVSKLYVPIICLQIAALCDCNYRRLV